MRARTNFALAVSFVVAACSGAMPATPSAPQPTTTRTSTPAQSPTLTPAQSPAPTRSPTPVPTASPHVAAGITLLGDRPVLLASDLGDGHYSAILPAAYFVADGTQHAYLVGFGAFPGDQDVFHATSGDGLAWEVDPADPFADLGIETSPPGPIPGSILEIDSQWVMYFWGVPSPQHEGAQIYRATAPGPGGPWIADPEPVVPVGAPGEVDDRGLDFPAVLPVDNGYLMLYGANGGDRPHAARILLARSEDGVEWEKFGRVLEPEACGGRDSEYIAIPRAFPWNDGFATLAVLVDDIVAALSDDGSTWTCPASKPIFRATEIPRNDRVHTIAATLVDGEIYVLIESLVGDGSQLWLGRVDGL